MLVLIDFDNQIFKYTNGLFITMANDISSKVKDWIITDKGEKVKDVVFGFQDGLISTYVLLVGIAVLIYFNPTLVLITLLAEVAAGAISMGFGAFVSTKTKNEVNVRNTDYQNQDPVDNAIYMSSAFVLGGIIPVIPFFMPIPVISFIIATISTFIALFLIGVFRALISEKGFLRPISEMIVIGFIAIIIISVFSFFLRMTYGLILLI